ncbi:hypothetical protein FS749_013623, partial [Ceratobasidium sp. UAMH 11750]
FELRPTLLVSGANLSAGDLSPIFTLMKKVLSRPGPAGTSCLTCKRRRKRCDKTRPACERCKASGFDCLGYAHLEQASLGPNLEESAKYLGEINYVSGTPLIVDAALRHPSSEFLLAPGAYPVTSPSNFTAGYSGAPFSSCLNASGVSTGFIHETSAYSCTLPSDYVGPPLVSEIPASRQDSSTEQPIIINPILHRSGTHHIDSSNGLPTSVSVWHPPNPLPFLPRMPSTLTPDSTGPMIDYILSQHEQLINLAYFKPLHQQIVHIRNSLSERLHTSQATRLAMFLRSNILRAILSGAGAEKFSAYFSWLHRFDQQLRLAPEKGVIFANLQDRLTGTLEVSFLKLRLCKSTNVYQTLQDSAPVFLQIALAVTTQQPAARPPSVISVASILASTRYELSHFILLDSFCSMLYALPQVIDYDTSVAPLESHTHPVEWIHGCPATFQATLVNINSLFHRKQPGSRLEWKSIEQYLKSWRPVIQASRDGESWGAIARLAIQESWRHTLLIYLYM